MPLVTTPLLMKDISFLQGQDEQLTPAISRIIPDELIVEATRIFII